MKKIAIIFILGLTTVLSPLFSSTNVKGFKGLFDIAYPFTLSKGQAAFTFGVNNIDLKTADIDVNRFFVGVGWGIIDNLEIGLNFSYNRVHMLEPGFVNAEYPYAERWQEDLGYASLGIKYNFLKNEKTGLGILAYFDLPLSDEEAAVSTGKSKFGFDLLFAQKFTETLIFSLNAGYQLNQQPDDFEIGNILKYAAGIETGLAKNLSLGGQLTGKVYSGSDYDQDNPLDFILGLKYEDQRFGIAVGYKKNILFNDKSLGDTHGGIGSIWIKTGKIEKPEECIPIEGVNIQGDDSSKIGESHSYQAVISPQTATPPVNYTWTVSDSGMLQSGQGTPTVSIKWAKEGSGWAKVEASNDCSKVSATQNVTVTVSVLPAKEEYFFAFDSYELSAATTQDLDLAVEFFNSHPDIQIEIQGHTCSIATEKYNLALGEHRAEAIKQYLVEKGISADRIKTISYGEEKPAYDNSAEKTRKKNRRAYIPANKSK